MIQRLLQAMVLRLHTPACHASGHWRVIENGRQVPAPPLPVIYGRLHIEHIDAPDHFIYAAEAEVGHILPHLLRQKEEEVDDVLWLTLKLLAQHGILRGDAHRTSIEMALAHHDAAHRNQRRGGETEFFSPEQRRYHDIAPSLQFPIRLHADSTAQIVQQEHLLRLRQPKLPGNARVLDRTER